MYNDGIYRESLYGDSPDIPVAQPIAVQPEAIQQSPIDPHTMSWGDLMKHSMAGGGETGSVQSGGIGKYRKAVTSFF